MNKKLGKSLNKFYSKKVNVQETLYGELGIPVNGVKRVDVPGRPGYVYVRLRGNNSELVQAYNSAVPTKYDYPVIVLRKKNTYTILGRDQGKYSNMGNIGQTVGFTPLPNHGGQHSFNPSLGMGADPTWVFSQQFMPQLIYPSGSSMLLAVSPHFYEWEGQWKYPQTTTPSFAPYVPTATGSARMALLFMDGDTGALNIVGGVGFSGGINNAADLAQYIPDIDRNNSIPLAAVKLGTGTTAIGWDDIYDMRDFYTVSKYFQGIGVQDSGVPAGTGHILNFGNNLAVTFAGNVATIDATAGGGGGGMGVVGWNEGVFLGTGTILNFVGDGIDASISGTVIQVRVTGSASADGWIAGAGTWSYSSADDPVFVASVPDADASQMAVGDRWKLTQTTVKYFIVVAIGSPSGGFTPVTVYGGTNHDLANAAISSPYYSHFKNPLGFPLSPALWTETLSDTSHVSQASPTASTWYNPGSLSLSIPIGMWNIHTKGRVYASHAGTTNLGIRSTLSTANNSESNTASTTNTALGTTSAVMADYGSFVSHRFRITLVAKTTHYLNVLTGTASCTAVGWRGDLVITLVTAECAYL